MRLFVSFFALFSKFQRISKHVRKKYNLQINRIIIFIASN